jgi:biopolymer transport protein ExbD
VIGWGDFREIGDSSSDHVLCHTKLNRIVDLPWARTSVHLVEAETDLTISVRADGHVFIDATIVPPRLLDAELASVADR